ncbi:hypothetical protein QCA50_017771 [Cerrena zonata]|uniref:Uncharacterized protein n=1 Tax=Cerrena zonata TaxID=2478898 RepID=A0AAW0FCE9_9APHY
MPSSQFIKLSKILRRQKSNRLFQLSTGYILTSTGFRNPRPWHARPATKQTKLPIISSLSAVPTNTSDQPSMHVSGYILQLPTHPSDQYTDEVERQP